MKKVDLEIGYDFNLIGERGYGEDVCVFLDWVISNEKVIMIPPEFPPVNAFLVKCNIGR